MEPDWDALIPELKQWNGGAGIDPESWVGCEGNFKLASAYSLIFWPEFVERDGMVFRANVDARSVDSFIRCEKDPSAVEALANHLHILDLHHVGCPDASVDRIVHLGRTLKEIYELKLAARFPSKSFEVEFYEPDDGDLQAYQLTFFQRRDQQAA